ncbi:hypothetical protein LG943_17425 [Streptomonospora sp. S1-112]|uniref:Uncharacterized protein n=1 Tax=Streptomonospora mangrovi TaxID=2883123 RepID=A0A9X3NN97_9ACTN|nr:hypothetical protein [Streptomonospora mangrovi]MDA0566080.1 hypothetical protein [Streptomonospora mangrovi]
MSRDDTSGPRPDPGLLWAEATGLSRAEGAGLPRAGGTGSLRADDAGSPGAAGPADPAPESESESGSESAAPYAMSPQTRAAARAAYAMRVDPAVLAGVSADSVETPATGIRAAALLADGPRYVTFHAPGMTIGLEITPRAEHCDVVGRVSPPGPTSVRVRHPRSTTSHTVDAYGTFIARAVPRGPVSLLLDRPEDAPIATEWLSV